MGQITNPAAPGITVLPIDRQTGPSAGPGATGNQTIFLGANAGQNSIPAQFIAIGNNAAPGGLNDVNFDGSVVLGASTVSVLTTTAYAPFRGPIIAIGRGILPLVNSLSETIAIGDGIGPLVTSQNANSGGYAYSNIFIGNNVLQNFSDAPFQDVIIGANAAVAGTVSNGNITRSVIIGELAVNDVNANTAIGDSVIIGQSALDATQYFGSFYTGILIGGGGTLPSLNNDDHGSVYIGAAIANAGAGFVQGGFGTPGSNVLIGYGAFASGSYNITIGSLAGPTLGNVWGQLNVCIGTGAGRSIGNGQNTIFDLTSVGPVGGGSLIWGNFANGNMLLGNSRANLDLDTIAATNGVKIFNGSRGAGNPVGGGFFYVNAGALHWVGSSGTDTTLAVA